MNNDELLRSLEENLMQAIQEYQRLSKGLLPQVITLDLRRRGQDQKMYLHDVKVLVGTT